MKIKMTVAESFELVALLQIVKNASDEGRKKARGYPRKKLESASRWASHFIRAIADAGARELEDPEAIQEMFERDRQEAARKAVAA